MKISRLYPIVIIIGLLIMTIMGCLDNPANTDISEDGLKKVEALHVEAILNQDSLNLSKILSGDLIVNAPNHSVVNKEMALEALRSGYIDYASYKQAIESIQITEHIGIVMGLETVMPRGLTGQEGTTEKRRFTDIWRFQNGRWVMIARQATNLCGD